jgi:hypothetical protein
VKDPFVPGPRLEKEVKYSSLTILVLFHIIFISGLWKQAQVWGILYRTRVHCLGKKSLLGTEDTRSGGNPTSKVFPIIKVPFLISPRRFFFAYLFIIVLR